MSESLRHHLRDVPDFPSPGITFRDVTPLLRNADALAGALGALTDLVRVFDPTVVLGIESRGFLFGVPVADRLGLGFVPVRKPGKLPWAVHQQAYGLEYGSDVLELHVDALGADDRVVVIDDVLATGGTARAACSLVEVTGARVVGVAVLVELLALGGRAALTSPVVSVLTY